MSSIIRALKKGSHLNLTSLFSLLAERQEFDSPTVYVWQRRLAEALGAIAASTWLYFSELYFPISP